MRKLRTNTKQTQQYNRHTQQITKNIEPHPFILVVCLECFCFFFFLLNLDWKSWQWQWTLVQWTLCAQSFDLPWGPEFVPFPVWRKVRAMQRQHVKVYLRPRANSNEVGLHLRWQRRCGYRPVQVGLCMCLGVSVCVCVCGWVCVGGDTM